MQARDGFVRYKGFPAKWNCQKQNDVKQKKSISETGSFNSRPTMHCIAYSYNTILYRTLM